MRFDRTGEWLDQIAPRSRATRVMTTCVSKSRSAASLAALAFGPGFFPIITQLLLRHALFLSSFPSPQGLSRKRITIQGPPFRTVRSMGGSESDGRPKSAAPVQRSLRWTRPLCTDRRQETARERRCHDATWLRRRFWLGGPLDGTPSYGDVYFVIPTSINAFKLKLTKIKWFPILFKVVK